MQTYQRNLTRRHFPTLLDVQNYRANSMREEYVNHDWEPTLKLMSEGKINADKMITHKVGIDEWEKTYKLIKSG